MDTFSSEYFISIFDLTLSYFHRNFIGFDEFETPIIVEGFACSIACDVMDDTFHF